MLLTTATLLLAGTTLASPLEERQSCPKVHVFGARETTVSQGYGSSSTVVNLVLGAYSGSTAEAIVYPACGGQSSCGSVSYANSVQQGVAAVTSAVNSFNTKCPTTQLVLVGYSQVCLILPSVHPNQRLTFISGRTNLRRRILWRRRLK